MHTHRTNTSVTGITVVEPVMMISDIVWSTLTLHTAHTGLTGSPKMAIVYGDIFRIGLHVYGSITFGMVSGTGLTIEDVHIMYPDIGIVGIQRDTIIHLSHDTEIAKLYALGISYQKAEAMYRCIITDTFYRDVQFAVGSLSLDLDTFTATSEIIRLAVLNQTNDSYIQRICDISLLISRKNGL